MNRRHGRRHYVEHDNVHRWLVSYADYMTLMFALFVVLYAMAMVNEKPYDSVTESIGRIFQADKVAPANRGHGDDILPVNEVKSRKNLFGNAILDVAGSNLIEGEPVLSYIESTLVGSNLTSLEKELHTALFDLVESGFAKLTVDGDWLEIEISSGLLFPSGSSSTTRSASAILSVIYDVIGDISNFIRIRGYTDDQPINTEIFNSNWELSVFRATAVLRELEKMNLNPARMAIEGYGQYYPSTNNTTVRGRAKNRRVVIAISKYGLEQKNILTTPIISVEDVEDVEDVEKIEQLNNADTNEIKVIRLDNGGLRITTRKDEPPPENKQ
ncbi:MAG: OmpA family protein [Alteromonadaceae bacterium]|nr:OmpA family protein [Alteromonadaceae bacterium]